MWASSRSVNGVAPAAPRDAVGGVSYCARCAQQAVQSSASGPHENSTAAAGQPVHPPISGSSTERLDGDGGVIA